MFKYIFFQDKMFHGSDPIIRWNKTLIFLILLFVCMYVSIKIMNSLADLPHILIGKLG